MALAGTFMKDLLARLRGGQIKLAPLAERREEIIPIIEKVLRDKGRPEIKLSYEFQRAIVKAPWPENVRQLKNTIDSILAQTNRDILLLNDIPKEIRVVKPVAYSEDASPAVKTDTCFDIRLSSDLTQEEMNRVAFLRLLDMKRELLGSNATQEEIAASMGISRSSLQRQLRDLKELASS